MTIPTSTVNSLKRKYEETDVLSISKRQKNDIEELGKDDIIINILKQLDLQTIVTCSLISKKWSVLTKCNVIWQPIASEIGCRSVAENVYAEVKKFIFAILENSKIICNSPKEIIDFQKKAISNIAKISNYLLMRDTLNTAETIDSQIDHIDEMPSRLRNPKLQ